MKSTNEEQSETGELKKRPDLLAFDPNRDGVLDTRDLERAAQLIGAGGVEFLVDDFVQRWDLDGDGSVGPGELPDFARTAVARRTGGRSR